MASNVPQEDGEMSADSDATNASTFLGSHDSEHEAQTALTNTSQKKKRKKSRYKELSQRFTALENLLHKFVGSGQTRVSEMGNAQPDPVSGQTRPLVNVGQTQHSAQTLQGQTQVPSKETGPARTGRRRVAQLSDSDSDVYNSDDNVSIHARGQISPERESDTVDKNNNLTQSEVHSSDPQRKGLYEMFGDDALVKKQVEKVGIVLDNSQIEVLNQSYRASDPNFLSAFSEETFDAFPVDSKSESVLQVPSLDSLVEGCLTKRYGQKSAFVKNKAKSLFTQPSKMVEKIGYKGQQAARLGLVIQMYIQQSLGNLLEFLNSDDFDKEKAAQASHQVKDIFAMSTKCLDQIGRSGAFHHIIRRSVAMTDTGLYEQSDHLEFANLPLSGQGVFGDGLETLLKSRKEKKKQIDDLIPDVKKGVKRKYTGYQSESNKRPVLEKPYDKPASNTWNNFRIPKLSREDRSDHYNRGRPYTRQRGGYGSFPRRSATSGRGKLVKTDEK